METAEGPCPAGEADRLREGRRDEMRWAWMFGLAGTAMFGFCLHALLFRAALPMPGTAQASAWLVTAAIFAQGMARYARAKGRDASWGLLGLGFVFGWLVLCFIPSKCGWCGRLETRRLAECQACGGPL